MALNLKTFATRTITAIIFVTVLLAGICYNYVSFTVYFLWFLFGAYEFYQLAEKLGAKPYKWIGYLAGACMFGYSIVGKL
jgi:phosphatidate cytidylyltransferase